MVNPFNGKFVFFYDLKPAFISVVACLGSNQHSSALNILCQNVIIED